MMAFSLCRRRIAWLPVYLLVLTVGLAAQPAHAAPGLLLIAHGSPSPEWNRPVLQFGERVAETLTKQGKYKAVRTALLESSQPDVPTAIAELEAAGCDRIVAIPLFIAPTGHTHFDVPAVLGIYTSAKTSATLAEENAQAARPRVPILLTETLADSEVLDRYAADEVRKLSKSPGQEAIVFLIHGDPDHALLVERLMRRVTSRCCGESGIRYGDWASIAMGQEYGQALAAITRAKEQKQQVLVVGLYLATTAAKIHQRSARGHHHGHGPAAGNQGPDPRLSLSTQALINHPALLDWVVKTAQSAASGEQKT